MGRVRLVSTVRPVTRGMLEYHRWTAPYAPPETARSARSLRELRVALHAELAYIEEVEADGWELYTELPGEPELVEFGEDAFTVPPTAGARPLVDTRRPDEILTDRDLP